MTYGFAVGKNEKPDKPNASRPHPRKGNTALSENLKLLQCPPGKSIFFLPIITGVVWNVRVALDKQRSLLSPERTRRL